MTGKKVGNEPAVSKKFNPKDLTLEQQEAVVKEYLGYHPKFFIYEGLKIRFNRSRFEAESRSEKAKNPKATREWFNGWKPKEYRW